MNTVQRINTHSCKWDGLKKEFGEEGLLAMWVADMDFPTPACVTQALQAYLQAPLGYFVAPDSYYDAVIQWEKERHGYAVQRDWICVTPGIVPALHWAVRAFTQPGDGVLVCTPVYYPFMNAVNNCEGRRLVKCELKKTGTRYEMDFDAFEQAIVEQGVKLHILCNPHNPVGRVWTQDELRRVLEICRKHGVLVISDEIHQDIINPSLGRKKVTTATVGDYNDMVITMASASKTFNLAAVQNSFIILPNPTLRARFGEFLHKMAIESPNGFGHTAAEAALRGGEAWLEDVLHTIYGNYAYLQQRFAAECPAVKISDLEGTYLAWMDLSAFCANQEEVAALVQTECKLALDYGSWFGSEGGNTFVRLNLATGRENVQTACDRLLAALAKRA